MECAGGGNDGWVGGWEEGMMVGLRVGGVCKVILWDKWSRAGVLRREPRGEMEQKDSSNRAAKTVVDLQRGSSLLLVHWGQVSQPLRKPDRLYIGKNKRQNYRLIFTYTELEAFNSINKITFDVQFHIMYFIRNGFY